MDSSVGRGNSWPETDMLKPTSDPNLTMSVIEEEVPALTVAAIVGLIVVMLVAIVAVFILGVLIDCRQQRLLDKKMGEVKRLKSNRRSKSSPEDDEANIASNMEQSDMSAPPAEVITHIP